MSCNEEMNKQIAEVPYEDYYMDIDLETGEPYPIAVAYFCPNCYEMVDENETYCKCGQKIKWGN